MQLACNFDYSKVKFDQDNIVHLLLKATAPKVDWQGDRKPINIIAVVDTSTSMGQSGKIEYAKKSLMKLVDHLSPDDRLGIIAFDTEVITLCETAKMTQEKKDQFKAEVSKLGPRGWTDYYSALHTALKQAASLNEDVRIIFFTDGQPTKGITDNAAIIEMQQSMRGKKTTLTTFGYGADHSSQFLAQMATLGGGNFAYIKNPDEAMTAFAKELGGLLSCYAQNLVFTVSAKEKVEIMEVISDLTVEEAEITPGVSDKQKFSRVKIKAEDLYSEHTRNVVLKLKLLAQPKIFPRETTVVDLVLDYEDTQSKSRKKSVELKAKIEYVKAEDVSAKPDQEVMDQVVLANLMKAQAEADKHAKSGNFVAAQSVLRSVDMTFARQDHYDLAGFMAVSYAAPGSYAANANDLATTSSTYRKGRVAGSSLRAKGLNSFVNHDNEAILSTSSTFNDVPEIIPPPALQSEPPKAKVEEEKKGLSKTKSDVRW